MLKELEKKKVFSGYQYRYQHDSQVLKCSMVFTLFLPKSDNNQAIPLIWWLSGLTCDDQNFATKGGFQAYAQANQQAIVIPDTSPRGEGIPDDEAYDLGQGASFYLDASQEPWSQNYLMYTYLSQELPKLVKSLIPNFSGQEAIMGHSMGGYGALMLALRQPERFQSVSAFAPITNPSQVEWGEKAFSNYLGDNRDQWETYDPIYLLNQEKVPPMLITQGTADEFYPNQLTEDAFLSAANQYNHQVTYNKEEAYDHSYYTIASFIGQHLAFHHDHLRDNI